MPDKDKNPYELNFFIRDAAYQLASYGLSVIPTNDNKEPTVPTWKPYQETAPDAFKINNIFDKYTYGVAIITGKVSANLELLDEDCKYDITGTMHDDFVSLINEQAPGLIEKLLIEKSVNGGYHYIYRCAQIEGSLKLASRPATEEEINKKAHEKQKVLYETKGEGGYFVCAPTKGYEIIQGTFANIPLITPEEREILIGSARAFNQLPEVFEPRSQPKQVVSSSALSPFSDYDQRADVISLLEKHGWTVAFMRGAKTFLKRPGDTKAKQSGNFDREKNWFSVFSTSTEFQNCKAYKPYAVFAVLECNGDFSLAAKKLYEMEYGDRKTNSTFTQDKVLQPSLATILRGFRDLAREGANLKDLKKVFGNYILESSTVLFPSERGVGKTYFMLQLAIAIANEASYFCGEKLEIHGNILYINFELGESVMKRRLARLYRSLPNGKSQYESYCLTYRGNIQEHFNEICEAITKCNPVLVIIDNLRAAFSDKDNEKNKEMAKAIMDLNKMKDNFHFAFVIVHHTKKGSSDKITDSDLQSGAGAITDIVDADFFLRKSKQDKDYRILKRIKSRECEEQDGAKLIRLNRDTLWFEFVEENVDESDHIFQDVKQNDKTENKHIAFQLKGEGKTNVEIADQLGVNKSTVGRWFAKPL